MAQEQDKNLEKIQNENKIHRQSTRGVKEWEQLYRSIDSGLTTKYLTEKKWKVKYFENWKTKFKKLVQGSRK